MRLIKRFLLLCCLSVMLMGVNNCAKYRVRADAQASAIESNDETGLIEGCGQQLQSGLLYCRKQEGDVAKDAIYFVAPPARCLGDGPCVSFKIYFPDATPTYGDSIPQGHTRSAPVLWSTLLKKQTFGLADRGLWPFTYTMRWIDQDGKEQTSYTTGEIVLRVFKKGYTPLISVSGDQNFAWSWIENGVPVKATSGLRIFVGHK
jgi:hypothetical protein